MVIQPLLALLGRLLCLPVPLNFRLALQAGQTEFAHSIDGKHIQSVGSRCAVDLLLM
jgi:hypothetical protein